MICTAKHWSYSLANAYQKIYLWYQMQIYECKMKKYVCPSLKMPIPVTKPLYFAENVRVLHICLQYACMHALAWLCSQGSLDVWCLTCNGHLAWHNRAKLIRGHNLSWHETWHHYGYTVMKNVFMYGMFGKVYQHIHTNHIFLVWYKKIS